jgi:hypothetical protein
VKRFSTIAVCIGALAIPAVADARVRELGAEPAGAQVGCPDNCQAITRTTGYQTSSGSIKNPYSIRRDGYIVAWTITLGRPSAEQISYFQDSAAGSLGLGPPSARISVVRKGTKKKNRLMHRLIAASPVQRLDRYYGTSPSFVLREPIRVERGNTVALTVPSWAPAFAVGLTRDFAWFSSRHKTEEPDQSGSRCGDVSQNAAQETLGAVRRYECRYRTARLLYSVTFVPDPRQTNPGN